MIPSCHAVTHQYLSCIKANKGQHRSRVNMATGDNGHFDTWDRSFSFVKDIKRRRQKWMHKEYLGTEKHIIQYYSYKQQAVTRYLRYPWEWTMCHLQFDAIMVHCRYEQTETLRFGETYNVFMNFMKHLK